MTTTHHLGRMFLFVRRLAASLGTTVLCVTGASTLGQPAAASPTQAAIQTLADRFDAAMQAYERNQWPQAFDALRQLAELGHADASRVVMQMHQHGLQLYGQQFALTAGQLARFSQQRRAIP